MSTARHPHLYTLGEGGILSLRVRPRLALRGRCGNYTPAAHRSYVTTRPIQKAFSNNLSDGNMCCMQDVTHLLMDKIINKVYLNATRTPQSKPLKSYLDLAFITVCSATINDVLIRIRSDI